MKRFTLAFLAIFVASLAKPAAKFELTIDNIMRGPQLYGYEPAGVRWSGDGERIYFQWKRASDPLLKPADTYVVGRDGSALRKLSDDEAKLAPPAAGDTTRDTEADGLFARRRYLALRCSLGSHAANHQNRRHRKQSAFHAR